MKVIIMGTCKVGLQKGRTCKCQDWLCQKLLNPEMVKP